MGGCGDVGGGGWCLDGSIVGIGLLFLVFDILLYITYI